MAEPVLHLSADECVREISRISRRLGKADAGALASLIQRDPARATRMLNRRLIGKALSEDDVLQILREALRDLATAGDA